MKGWFSRLLAVTSLATCIAAFAAPAHAEKRVALVIGNNDYRNVPKLQKAVNDARTMGDTLKQLGFTVMVAENQNRQAFSQTLLAFDNAVEAGDAAFFFYAGHGFEIAGQNFLLPTDVPAATEGQEELVRDASVLADRIIERMQNKKVRTAILVFDACRNNPFERAGTRAVAGGGGLAPMTQLPEGVFSVFSAGPRQTALDRLSNNGDNPNSVFTRTLAKKLRQPGANLVQVDPRTRKRMPNPSIELPADAPAATIQVRYVDTSGELQGPFPIRFDPEAALIRDQRKILDMTATSWLSFREFNGLLVYYSHLLSYRCAIREVRVGIDTAVPDKVLKMPPCDPRDPSVIPHDAQPYLKLAPATKSVSVELTYRDGSVSEIESFRR